MFNQLRELLAKKGELQIYTNELDLMFSHLTAAHPTVRDKVVFQALEKTQEEHRLLIGTASEMIQKSEIFRQEGNQQYKAGQSVEAIRLYTKALCIAPAGSEQLHLALANRGLVLLTLGYLRQSYDDCACALEAGYPASAKIILRMAFSAAGMGDRNRAVEHVATLSTMQLNESLEKSLQVVRGRIEDLMEADDEEDVLVEEFNPEVAQSKTYIMEIAGRGRGVVARKDIEKNELIFEDRAVSLVPVLPNRSLCQKCGVTQIIPMPCHGCHGWVVYCSSKCRQADARLHAYECEGWKIGMFTSFAQFHAAFRTTLTLLPEIVDRLAHLRTARAVWQELVPPLNILSGSTQLAQVLSMETHLADIDEAVLASYGFGVLIMTVYLRKYTDFHQLFASTKAGVLHWELITAALMLRLYGQLLVNTTGVQTLGCTLKDDFPMLASNIWLRAEHLKMGELHKFSKVHEACAMVFPYLSLCNNSRNMAVATRQSGLNVSTYPNSPVQANEEIFKTYVEAYREAPREMGPSQHFVCQCLKCQAPRDKVDNEFIKQRCIYTSCSRIFSPVHTAEMKATLSLDNFVCTWCNRRQPAWLLNCVFMRLLNVTSVSSRQLLFQSFRNFDSYYLEHNDLKAIVAGKIASKCIQAELDGLMLTNCEFGELEYIIKLRMAAKEKRAGLSSIHYVASMTHLWDLYALRKQPIDEREMEPMLKVVSSVLSDEFKLLFMNYYNDFMKPLVTKHP